MALSDEEQQARRDAVLAHMPTTPYLAGRGVVLDRYEADDVTVRLPFREDLTNDGRLLPRLRQRDPRTGTARRSRTGC